MKEYETIDELLQFFSRKFPFGIHDQDDIYQQGWVYSLEAIHSGRFDPDRGNLKSFLFSVLYSRFINFKRNEHYRPETPCRSCPFNIQGESASPCEVFSDLRDCPLYADWDRRNAAKKSISCSSIEISPDHPHRGASDVDLDEFPEDLRSLALRASTGEKLRKHEKKLLKDYLESHNWSERHGEI